MSCQCLVHIHAYFTVTLCSNVRQTYYHRLWQLHTRIFCKINSNVLYIWLVVPCGSLKNINDIPMRSKTPSLVEMKRTCDWKFVRSSYIGGDISDQHYLEETVSLNKLTSWVFSKITSRNRCKFWGSIAQPYHVLRANPMVASGPSLTRGPDANKKNEIRRAQSRDISSLNLGVVNWSQIYSTRF